MGGIDWTKAAEGTILETEGTHPVEFCNAKALISIADSLIAIARALEGLERCSECECRLRSRYKAVEGTDFADSCPNCGPKTA